MRTTIKKSDILWGITGQISRLIYISVLVCLFMFFLAPISVHASQTVLDEIKIIPDKNKTQIDIDLGLPLGYVKHFPQTFGEILQIQLLLEEESGRSIHKEVRQGNELKPPPGHEQLLVYVTYEEGVPGGPYLTLRFSHPVRFEVQAGSSLTTLTVVVHEAKKTAKQALPALDEKKDKRLTPSEVQERKKEKSPDDELMAKARQQLTFGDNTGAIDLLRKVIAIPGSKHSQDARELLGLALERSNQIPRAKFEYKKYLKLYKEGAGPRRVQQRLNALQSIGVEPKRKLRRTTRSKRENRFRVFGRLSQAYSTRFLQRKPDDPDDRVQSEDLVLTRLITTNLNVRGRYRGETSNMQAVVSTNHTYDNSESFSSQGNLVENDTESRITEMYLDYDEFKLGYSGTIGRQRLRKSGVFSRFDGLVGGYSFNPEYKMYAYAGKPVSFFNIDFDKEFVGLRLDYGKKRAPLSANAYMVSQTVDGVGDRSAVGGGIQYADKTMTAFALIDYDVLYDELTLANLRWGWRFENNSKINLSYNYRFLLFTSSAINQQKILSVEGLNSLSTLSESDLRDMAKARTSANETVTIGYTYQFSKEKQINADVSMFTSDGTDAYNFTQDQIDEANLDFPELIPRDANGVQSGNVLNNVTGLESTGNQFSYSLQYIASNWLFERDLHVLGMRYSDFSSYDEILFFFNSRMPPLNGWKLRPRLNVSQRSFKPTNTSASGERYAIGPSLKVDYAWKKKWVFDVELGFSWIEYSDARNPDEVRQNIRVGYHYTF